MKATTKHAGGAPSKFKGEETIQKAGWLARDGKIDKEIAQDLGISEATLNNWKKQYPKFLESIKNNKAVIDAKVEDSLLKRAIGYDYEKTEIEVSVRGKNQNQIKKTITVHVPPDPVSIIFWLCNRQPTKWRRNNPVELDWDKAKGEINTLFDQMKEGPVVGITGTS